jgi:hypothetical protein
MKKLLLLNWLVAGLIHEGIIEDTATLVFRISIDSVYVDEAYDLMQAKYSCHEVLQVLDTGTFPDEIV